jgi:hypothetical protein
MAFETFAKSALLNDCIVLAMDALNSEQYKYSTKIVSKCWEADRLVVEVACRLLLRSRAVAYGL